MSEVPKWDCLPQDPMGFFGLPEEFQRNDLKRSYTKLIKRFKPEKHPAEFQKIRAAYEELDNRLRFGQSESDPVWSRVAESGREPPQATNSKPATDARESPLQAIRKSLSKQPLATIYRELAQQEDKQPAEFYALAILADLHKPSDQRQFLSWIMQGLERWPNDVGLLRLMHAAIQSGLGQDQAPELLLSLSRLVRTDGYFALTESLWLSQLMTMRFEEFAALLAACEQHIRDHRVHVRTVFYLGLVRASLFRAPDDWLTRVLQAIHQHAEYIPQYLEMDLEVTFALARYRIEGAGFRNGDALRERIHEAMFTYSQGELEGCRAVANVQVEFAGKWQEFDKSFPMDGMDHQAALQAWFWISADASQKMLIPYNPPDINQISRAVDQVMSEAHAQDNELVQSSLRELLVHTGWSFLSFLVMCTLALFMADLFPSLIDNKGNYIVVLFFGGGGLGLLLYRVFGFPRVKRRMQRKRREKIDRRYESRWRPKLFNTLNTTYGHWELVAQSIAGLAANNPRKKFPVIHEIQERAHCDFGLRFYDTTFLFVH